MPVRLPGYLDRPALVVRRDAEIIPLALSAWAAPLDEEFSRVLTQNLVRTLPDFEILRFPWPRSAPPEYRLLVEVEQFERDGGEVALRARWLVIAASKRMVVAVGDSYIRAPIVGPREQEHVAALSAALGRFGTDLARALHNDRRSFGGSETPG